MKMDFPFKLVLILALFFVPVFSASAEQAWIKGELHVNLRTGPSTDFRILGVLKTGDELTIIERQEKWVNVRTQDNREGWVPGSYLQTSLPIATQLNNAQQEMAQLQREKNALESELRKIRTVQEASVNSESTWQVEAAQQKKQIEELTRKNRELEVGRQIPWMLTGAAIFLAGLLCFPAIRILTPKKDKPKFRF